MAKNKERMASDSFNVSDAESEYSFQLKKKRRWWWLLLLLLLLIGLLLLLKRCPNNHNTNTPIHNDTVQPTPTPQPKPEPEPEPKPTDSIAPPVLKPCDELTQAGKNIPESFIFDMGQVGGTFVLEYNTGEIYPDKIVVYDGENSNANVIFSFNDVTPNGDQKAVIRFTQSKVYIEISPDQDTGTFWGILAHCPE